MKFILNFLLKNKQVLSYAFGFAVLLFVNLQTCKSNKDLKKQLAVATHNINALNDTIRVTTNRAGEVEFNKLALLTDKLSSLEQLNADLYNEIKQIKGKVSSIIKADVQVKEVEVPVPFQVNTEILDSLITAKFKLDTVFSPGNYRKLSGLTQYNLRTGQSVGELTNSEFGMRFVTGIKNLDKGKPEIFIESKYPGFTVTELDGAVLDPKLFQKKKVPTITLGIGVGWVPVTYDLKTNKTDFNLQRFGASVGVDINLIKLLKRK